MESNERFITLDETYIDPMSELYREAFGRDPWNDDWSDEIQLKKYIREISCSYNALNYGLFLDDKLTAVSIGQIRHWWEGTNYNIDEFCVAPRLQGKGIGSRFMAMIEEDIKKRGLSGIFLQTDIDKPSYKFYCKNGFFNLETHVSLYKRLNGDKA